MADDEKPPTIDEHFFREASDYFFNELDTYMKKAARFDAWLKRHGREEASQDDTEQSSTS